MAILRRARGVRIPTPGGTVIGRLRGSGAAYPIEIEDLARQIQSTGVVGGGGSAPGSFTAGSGISITGTWPSLTFSNTGVLSVTAPAAGFAVSASTGVVTFSLNHDLAALEALSSTGLAARTGTDTWAQRTITGTSGTITVTNGDGVSGNPTLTIDAAYLGQSSITTLGTIGTGTWAGTTIAVNHGGTGQTSYTDGQLLIGNSSGNTLAKGSLTAPAAGLTITGGAGSITFALANDLSALEALSSTGLAARTATDTWAQRTITASTGISVSNGDGVSGNPTITNTGVTSIVAGTNVTVSGATGAVTVNAPLAGSGNYLGRRVLSGSGTYTPTTGTASIVLKMVGGGPGGGGVPATSSVQQSEGSGGGAGAVIETYLTSGFSGVSYSVGAAGAGSSGANGTNGGDTTFGTRTAGGGTGGAVGLLTNLGVAGSLGGVVTGNVAGDIAFAGMRGWYSSIATNGGDAVSGRGADAPLGYGFGGSETTGSAAGVSATGYGAAGGGASNGASQSARAGGAGSVGIIIIDEYGPSAATSGVLSGLTTGKVPYATGASALGDSEITNTGGTGGVYIGSATGGQKGNGTLNATGLYINGVALAGTRSLFAEVMSIKPTQSNTGLNSWAIQQASATVADGTQGISLFQPAQSPSKHQGSYITKLVPATPYTVTALIAHTGRGQNNNAVQLGWWNGVATSSAKSHVFHHSYGDGFYVVHFNDGYANGATLAVDVGPDGINYFGPITWYRLTDDGTTAKFWISQDGENWLTFFSVTKSGSFLGASGFTNLVFGVDPTSQACYGNLLSWAVT